MAFGDIDHIENHVTGERKQVVSIDLDKEYGIKGYGSTKTTKAESIARKKSIEDFRFSKIQEVLCMPVTQSFLKEPFDSYLSLDSNQYSWKEDAIKGLSGDMLYNIHLLATKRVDSDGTPYYVNCKGIVTDYLEQTYIPRNINL